MGSARRGLSPRHQRVADLLDAGRSAAEIASELGLTLNTAEQYVRVVRRHHQATAAAASGETLEVSPRESEVAALVETGATNRDIAQRLGTSVRTAEAHVSNLLRRLGLSDRKQLVAQLAPSTGIGALSFRELEILRLVARGLSHEAIAERLNIEQRAVESHVVGIRKKLRVPGSRSLARYGMVAKR